MLAAFGCPLMFLSRWYQIKNDPKNLDFAERIGSVLDHLGNVLEGMGRVLCQLGRVLEAVRKSSQRLQDGSTMLQHALRHAIKVQKNNRQKSGLR